ncbi:MAG TPA: ROK family transcriptional regulator [Lacipirellulaceae bacterium]|nr:ROK family transcriptional regulator [Lacipirellulaceae bacterium]HMP06243.1 ROK family transcriptional regulator [Lacipirellulaceae bacterium]
MSGLLTGKPQLNRFINRRLILERVRRGGRISRADLAKQTEIRPPTVSAVIRELITEGLVEEVGPGQTSGGRAPRMIALARQKPCALGFELGAKQIVAALCDLSGAVTEHIQIPTGSMTPAEAIENLHDVGSELLARRQCEWSSLRGVGVAVTGHLDVSRGHLRWSQSFQWRDVPLKSLCEQRWDVPTDVVNDSHAGAMAVQMFELKQPVDNLVFMYLCFHNELHEHVGIGTGIVVHGELYHGEFGAAGEITNPIAHPVANLRATGTRCANVAEFVAAMQQDDPAAQAAIVRVGQQMEALIVHVVNLLEPGVFVISSDSPPLCDALISQFQRMLQEKRLAYEAGKTQLLSSTLGACGVAQGAVVPTLQRVFRLPQW